MINYIIATILALILGQVTAHLIYRLPEIVVDEDELKKAIPTLKTGFKWDVKYSVVLVILFNLVAYFVQATFLKYLYMFVIPMLIVALVLDFKMQLIPDTIQVVLLLLGIIATAVDYTNWLGHIIGLITGGGIYLLIAGFSLLVFRKEGMGMGDVKLMACLGLIFGIKGLPTGFLDFFAQADIIFTITILAFFMAAIVAILLIVIKKTEHTSYMAFGPYIVIGTILVMLFGTEPFLNAYLNICTGLSDLLIGWMFK